MNNEFDKIFRECKDVKGFKRVSPSHPIDLYLGYNDFNYKTLALIMDEIDMNFNSTKLIEVKINKRNDNKEALCFSLKDDTETDIFYKFCEDIIESTKSILPDKSISIINSRWNRWINMFKNPHLLIMKENEIRGLIGELLFLKNEMFKNYSIEESIEAWMGPNNSHKDFSINNTWYEIKTCYQSSKSITISSIEQLDSNNDGHLCVIELEDSNRFVENSISLNQLINNIKTIIKDEKIILKFSEKLEKVGYSYFEEYDNYIYYFHNMTKYYVDKSFPRLKYENIPEGITSASYELLLTNLKKYVEES